MGTAARTLERPRGLSLPGMLWFAVPLVAFLLETAWLFSSDWLRERRASSLGPPQGGLRSLRIAERILHPKAQDHDPENG
jgi:hypothetical protein